MLGVVQSTHGEYCVPGLPFAFMSGFCVAASRLGAPDTGLLSYGEVLDQGRSVNEATRQLPIIGDGDTGCAIFSISDQMP